jgi:hypothetical protein
MYLKWGTFNVPNGQIQIVPLVKLLNLSVLSKKRLPTEMGLWLFMMSKFHTLNHFTHQGKCMLWTNCDASSGWIICFLSRRVTKHFFTILEAIEDRRWVYNHKNLLLLFILRTFWWDSASALRLLQEETRDTFFSHLLLGKGVKLLCFSIYLKNIIFIQ